MTAYFLCFFDQYMWIGLPEKVQLFGKVYDSWINLDIDTLITWDLYGPDIPGNPWSLEYGE